MKCILFCLITNVLICSILAATSNSQLVKVINRCMYGVSQYDKVDDEVKDYWSYLRRKVNKSTLNVVNNENLHLQAALYKKLETMKNLANQIGPHAVLCSDVDKELIGKVQIVDPVNILWNKQLAMKNDAEECQKQGGTKECLLKTLIVQRCLRKNYVKHRWEVVPAINKVAEVYSIIESQEIALQACVESLKS